MKIKYLVKNTLVSKIEGVCSLSTGAYTPPSFDSSMSVTAHWIDEEYYGRFAVLKCVPLNTVHTSKNLATSLKLSLNNIQSPFRDKEQNIVKGVIEACFKGANCFFHILNLVAKHFVLHRIGGEMAT